MITLKKVNDRKYSIIHENGNHFADAIMGESGFFEFWPCGLGCLNARDLYEISMLLLKENDRILRGSPWVEL